MIDQEDLVWLADRQPETHAPNPLTTDQLRSEFTPALAHRRPRRRLAVVAGLTAIAAGVMVVVGQSLPAPKPAPVVRPAVVPSPLVRLARDVAATPALPGNATLVERHHTFPDAKPFSGYDLYTDAGPYYYGMTMDELRAAMVDPAADQGGYARVIKAAADSANLPPAQARARVYGASPMPAGSAPAMPARAAKARLAKLLKEKNAKVKDVHPASLKSRKDNYLWMNAMDAITAGAGRGDVRAGALNALATVTAVHVAETTLGGKDVLSVTNTDFPDGYRETLYLDADTGVLVHFRGGTAEKADVDVAYDIKRVDFNGSEVAPAK